MILFFDTETTGMYQWRQTPDHPDQPHIVQLAALLCHDDGRPIAGFSTIVDPGIGSSVAIIETAIVRRWGQFKSLSKPLYCTMEAASPIVNLPPTEKMIATGMTKPKSPKLEDCIKHFFGEDLADAHDAMADCVGCKRVYFHLKSLAGAKSAA